MSTYLCDSTDEDMYSSLWNALSSGNLVLFAGSGLSAQATTEHGEHPPLWVGLLSSMIEWCLNRKLIEPDYSDQLRELLAGNYLIEAGQELQETLEPGELQQCLGDSLFAYKARASEAHNLIAQIPFRAYLTTNYDELIEGEIRSHLGVSLPTYYERTITGVLDAYRDKQPFILKLHGDISDPASIILGLRSYDRLLYSYTDYRNCLETIFSTCSILFIGFKTSDPDLEAIISRVSTFDGRSKRHWVLLTEGSIPELKARRLWKDRGIKVIQYKRDAKHSGLVEFLRRLATPPPLSTVPSLDPAKAKSYERRSKIEAIAK